MYTHSFVKVPRPGDSEVTFLILESSCHLSAYYLITTSLTTQKGRGNPV